VFLGIQVVFGRSLPHPVEVHINFCYKDSPRHLAWEDLPEEQKFERLAPSRKRLTDTVKLVAYRAETALATIVREKLSHLDEARAWCEICFARTRTSPRISLRVC
jgi:hypothetical protein